MPRRNKQIDRRLISKAGEREEQDEEASKAPEPPPPEVDVIAFCSSCGTNDARQFSKRMLERRGRHGDRTRRCMACVDAGHFPQAAPTDAFMPTSVLSSAVRDKVERTASSRWAAAEADRERRARDYAAETRASAAAPSAAPGRGVRGVAGSELRGDGGACDGRRAVPGGARGGEAVDARGGAVADAELDLERKCKKLRKALRLIGELKRRHAAGVPLEASQVGAHAHAHALSMHMPCTCACTCRAGAPLEASQALKISREVDLRAELRDLEEGRVFLMPDAADEEEEGEEAATGAEPGGEGGMPAKRPRLDYDQPHQSASFAASSFAASSQRLAVVGGDADGESGCAGGKPTGRKRKAKRKRPDGKGAAIPGSTAILGSTKRPDGKGAAPAKASPDLAALLSHMSAVKSLY